MRFSPLDSQHRALGAKMVPFGGWEMPVAYPSGTLEEHRACRETAVVFDVSHLGTVRVEGPGATEALQATLTNDLHKVAAGRAQYTHLLAEDGSVQDDIIVWWIADEVFDVMPNASNTDGVLNSLRKAAASTVSIEDTTATRAILAIQGPNARDMVRPVSAGAAGIGRFRVSTFGFDGYSCTVAGTGYTGEDGIECAVPVEVAGAFWEALQTAGLTAAGLGARDTLRLEAGLPLHGHELGPGITSLNAGLGWVVAWDKGDFPGRSALEAQRDAGVEPVLKGIKCPGRRPPREGAEVTVGGEKVGMVTSGNFSPTLECGIAMALLDPAVAVGDAVTILQRGSELSGEVVEMPFVKK